MRNRKSTILVVDDDAGVLESLRLSLELDYDVLTASGGSEGLALLEGREVALIIADQRMPGMTGVEFLARSCEVSPRSIRMMLTGFADLGAVVEAINQGQIYRYIAKPWEPKDLEMDVRRALEVYDIREALDQRVRELGTLCEIGASITSDLNLDRVIQKILQSIVEVLGFNRAFLMLVDHGSGMLRNRACAGLSGEALEVFSQLEYRMDREDVAVVVSIRQNRSLLVEDVDDPQTGLDQEVVRRMGIRSFVTVPLASGDRKIGVIVADRLGAGERVTEHDRRLLTGFGNQAVIAMENARLFGEALEKRQLEEEASVAGRIQQHLLPAEMPRLDGVEVVGMSRPSRWVSGDYYDVLKDAGGRVWVALGDVSGKGMPAALTMATLRGLFRSELEHRRPLGETMRRIGDGLWRCTAPEVFATFCFGVLNPSAREFTFVNAGHQFPILARADGTSTLLESGGPPIGIDPTLIPGAGYDETRLTLGSGDSLVIYSDGVTEAGAGIGTGDRPQFGVARLRQAVCEHQAAGPAGIQAGICKAVDAFLGDVPLGDDLTLVVIGGK